MIKIILKLTSKQNKTKQRLCKSIVKFYGVLCSHIYIIVYTEIEIHPAYLNLNLWFSPSLDLLTLSHCLIVMRMCCVVLFALLSGKWEDSDFALF